MSRVFSRSLYALEADSASASVVWILTIAGLALAWSLWFFGARIAVVEHTTRARIETQATARKLQSTVTGRVLRNQLLLGAEVHAGDVVIELDATGQRMALEEKQQRRSSCSAQLTFLEQELRWREQNLGSASEAARAQQLEAQARRDEAQASSTFADTEVRRLNGLAEVGTASRLELQRAATEALVRQAARSALDQSALRLDWEAKRGSTEARATVARLQREIAALQGEVEQLTTAIARQARELSDFEIRSPVTGKVGEVVQLGAGAVVEPGDPLGAIVPNGEVLVVAEFAAASAVGRIRPGQRAEVRLAGFPWTEFGNLRARVSSVGSEAREGRVRTQLVIDAASNSRIPLQHGLTGTVDVEVDRTSPALLALRSLGRVLRAPSEEKGEP